jgi:dihydroxyacetone kinase-like predicted kinase
MLTVIREIYEAVAAKVDSLDEIDLDPAAGDTAQDAILGELLIAAVQAGMAAVERTPEQLDVLARAGVVDAGAHGLVVMLAGCIAGLAGQETGVSPVPHQSAALLDGAFHADSRFQFCTSCIVTGRELDPRSIAPLLEGLGDSIAVVGDDTMLKVHVHTDTPERVRDICAERGDVHQFEFTDMREQIAAREAAPRSEGGPRSGVVAVASGDGIAALFAREGAQVVDGGATLNPSIQEILAAISGAPADEVVVLPNSANVVMAAREAARLADRPAHVAASTSQQGGLAAMLDAFDPELSAEENASRLEAALATIATGLVAEADRDDGEGRYRRGEAVGFLDSELVAWGDPAETLAAVVGRLAGDAEIVTVLEGADAPVRAGDLALELANGAELEVEPGGQPTYWWLIAAQ